MSRAKAAYTQVIYWNKRTKIVPRPAHFKVISLNSEGPPWWRPQAYSYQQKIILGSLVHAMSSIIRGFYLVFSGCQKKLMNDQGWICLYRWCWFFESKEGVREGRISKRGGKGLMWKKRWNEVRWINVSDSFLPSAIWRPQNFLGSSIVGHVSDPLLNIRTHCHFMVWL